MPIDEIYWAHERIKKEIENKRISLNSRIFSMLSQFKNRVRKKSDTYKLCYDGIECPQNIKRIMNFYKIYADVSENIINGLNPLEGEVDNLSLKSFRKKVK